MRLSPSSLTALRSARTYGFTLQLLGTIDSATLHELNDAFTRLGGIWHAGRYWFGSDAAALLQPVLDTGDVPNAYRPPRILSYGGGLNSFALLVDAINRNDKPDVCVFLDVTDPSRLDPGEWPGTYTHIRDVAMPLCEQHGIRFVWLDTTAYPIRDARSLFDWMFQRGQIPVTGPNRICTIVAKVERFELWMDHTFPGREVEVWVGFEAGEESRAANDPNAGSSKRSRSKRGPRPAHRVNRFPLMERGLCRCRCEALVRDAGFPVPRKSACCWCPYGTKGDWQTFARELPDYFQKVVDLEARKAPTARGLKLSIMGFRSVKDADGNVTAYKAPPLPEFIQGAYKRKAQPCPVCGAAERASKEAGCGYLP